MLGVQPRSELGLSSDFYQSARIFCTTSRTHLPIPSRLEAQSKAGRSRFDGKTRRRVIRSGHAYRFRYSLLPSPSSIDQRGSGAHPRSSYKALYPTLSRVGSDRRASLYSMLRMPRYEESSARLSGMPSRALGAPCKPFVAERRPVAFDLDEFTA